MQRTFWTVVSLIIIGIAGPLWGATITVDTVDPGIAADGWCSLIEAIENANADGAVREDCPADAGADVIEGETHISVVPTNFSRGLRILYPGVPDE